MMKKRLLFILLCMLTALVACSNDENKQEEQVEAKDMEEVQDELENVSEHIYPLTGLASETEVTDRMVAVMVNNHPKARPQTGLSHADLVFEILAEGTTTRFMALFQSDIPDRVGPVRSARPYYFNLANDYNAIYVYHGAAKHIEDMIQTGSVQGLNGMYFDDDKVLFERSTDRVAPHNSYAIFNGIYERAEEEGYPLHTTYQPMTFLSENETVGGTPVTDVSFDYGSNSVSYHYDEQIEKYVRYNDGVQTVEYTDSTPITLDNVLIMEAAHQVIDDEGRREIDLQSGGNALLLQRGKVQNVQWERNDGRIIPTKDGEPVPLVPGQTWINVIPTSSGIDSVQLSSETE